MQNNIFLSHKHKLYRIFKKWWGGGGFHQNVGPLYAASLHVLVVGVISLSLYETDVISARIKYFNPPSPSSLNCSSTCMTFSLNTISVYLYIYINLDVDNFYLYVAYTCIYYQPCNYFSAILFIWFILCI